MRLACLCLVAVALAGAPAVAQETETPSSRPAPSPGNPAPTVGAPRGETATAAAPAPDDSAGQAAIRAQCGADRARFCSGAAEAGACLSANFTKLTPDCQSAVNALKEARGVRNGDGG